MRSATRHTFARFAGALLLTVGTAACSGHSPSSLEPRGPGAHRIAGLWWFMFWTSAAVVAVVTALILLGVLSGRRRREVRPDGTPRWAGRMVVLGGVVVPVVILSLLWVLTLLDSHALSLPRSVSMKVQVIGHQWWWEVRYPQQGVVTANDIHIPVGSAVEVELTTDDVIHSFWVPQLTGKIDLISGRTNRLWIQADRPGVYRGQCAEYCGLQHANMIFYVVADPPARFGEWLQAEAQPAATPTDATALRGQDVFLSNACVGCHTIRGTEAGGDVGPDLTHIGSRVSLGAGTLPNTPTNLAIWISDSQAVKPGNLMPPIPLSSDDLEAVVAYLESLK